MDRPDVNGEDYWKLESTEIRFFWDFGATYPLWNDGLRDDPEWLRRVLGLSEPTIQALAQWSNANEAWFDRADLSPEEKNALRDHLDVQGHELAETLQQEVGPAVTITYGP